MSPKIFKCPICGEEISKRKSVMIDFQGKKQRVCKHHPEAIKGVEIIKNKEKEEKNKKAAIREDRLRKIEERQDPRWFKKMQEEMIHTCWTCGSSCYTKQEFAMKCLIAIERLELKNKKFDIFQFPSNIRKEMVVDKPVVSVISMEDEKMFDFMINRTKYKYREVVRTIKHTQLCETCIKKYNLQKFIDKEINLSRETIDTLTKVGIEYQKIFKPFFKYIAKKQLEDEGSI